MTSRKQIFKTIFCRIKVHASNISEVYNEGSFKNRGVCIIINHNLTF